MKYSDFITFILLLLSLVCSSSNSDQFSFFRICINQCIVVVVVFFFFLTIELCLSYILLFLLFIQNIFFAAYYFSKYRPKQLIVYFQIIYLFVLLFFDYRNMSNSNTENNSTQTTATAVPIHQGTEIPATIQTTPLGKDIKSNIIHINSINIDKRKSSRVVLMKFPD